MTTIERSKQRDATKPYRDWLLYAMFLGILVGMAMGAIAQPQAAAQASPPKGTPQPLSALTSAATGRQVTVVGKITNKIAPYDTTGRTPYKWYVTDGKGVALIVLFPAEYRALADPDTRFPDGAVIQVRGKVSEYRGTLQLSPGSVADIQPAVPDGPQGIWGLSGEPAAPAAASTERAVLPATPPEGYIFPAGATKDQLNKTIKVAGQVAKYRASWSSTAPNILTLEGGGGTLDVVYWSDVDNALGTRKADLTTAGKFVKAEGKLTEYRNRLQLRIAQGGDLQAWAVAPSSAVAQGKAMTEAAGEKTEAAAAKPAVAASASSAATGGARTPSQITKDDLNKTLVVRGTVKSVREPTSDRAPTRVELTDDSGSITVVYWKEQAAQFTGDNAPQVGKPWAVEGKVSEFRNRLQIRASAPAK